MLKCAKGLLDLFKNTTKGVFIGLGSALAQENQLEIQKIEFWRKLCFMAERPFDDNFCNC